MSETNKSFRSRLQSLLAESESQLDPQFDPNFGSTYAPAETPVPGGGMQSRPSMPPPPNTSSTQDERITSLIKSGAYVRSVRHTPSSGGHLVSTAPSSAGSRVTTTTTTSSTSHNRALDNGSAIQRNQQLESQVALLQKRCDEFAAAHKRTLHVLEGIQAERTSDQRFAREQIDSIRSEILQQHSSSAQYSDDVTRVHSSLTDRLRTVEASVTAQNEAVGSVRDQVAICNDRVAALNLRMDRAVDESQMHAENAMASIVDKRLDVLVPRAVSEQLQTVETTFAKALGKNRAEAAVLESRMMDRMEHRFREWSSVYAKRLHAVEQNKGAQQQQAVSSSELADLQAALRSMQKQVDTLREETRSNMNQLGALVDARMSALSKSMEEVPERRAKWWSAEKGRLAEEADARATAAVRAHADVVKHELDLRTDDHCTKVAELRDELEMAQATHEQSLRQCSAQLSQLQAALAKNVEEIRAAQAQAKEYQDAMSVTDSARVALVDGRLRAHDAKLESVEKWVSAELVSVKKSSQDATDSMTRAQKELKNVTESLAASLAKKEGPSSDQGVQSAPGLPSSEELGHQVDELAMELRALKDWQQTMDQRFSSVSKSLQSFVQVSEKTEQLSSKQRSDLERARLHLVEVQTAMQSLGAAVQRNSEGNDEVRVSIGNLQGSSRASDARLDKLEERVLTTEKLRLDEHVETVGINRRAVERGEKAMEQLRSTVMDLEERLVTLNVQMKEMHDRHDATPIPKSSELGASEQVGTQLTKLQEQLRAVSDEHKSQSALLDRIKVEQRATASQADVLGARVDELAMQVRGNDQRLRSTPSQEVVGKASSEILTLLEKRLSEVERSAADSAQKNNTALERCSDRIQKQADDTMLLRKEQLDVARRVDGLALSVNRMQSVSTKVDQAMQQQDSLEAQVAALDQHITKIETKDTPSQDPLLQQAMGDELRAVRVRLNALENAHVKQDGSGGGSMDALASDVRDLQARVGALEIRREAASTVNTVAKAVAPPDRGSSSSSSVPVPRHIESAPAGFVPMKLDGNGLGVHLYMRVWCDNVPPSQSAVMRTARHDGGATQAPVHPLVGLFVVNQLTGRFTICSQTEVQRNNPNPRFEFPLNLPLPFKDPRDRQLQALISELKDECVPERLMDAFAAHVNLDTELKFSVYSAESVQASLEDRVGSSVVVLRDLLQSPRRTVSCRIMHEDPAQNAALVTATTFVSVQAINNTGDPPDRGGGGGSGAGTDNDEGRGCFSGQRMGSVSDQQGDSFAREEGRRGLRTVGNDQPAAQQSLDVGEPLQSSDTLERKVPLSQAVSHVANARYSASPSYSTSLSSRSRTLSPDARLFMEITGENIPVPAACSECPQRTVVVQGGDQTAGEEQMSLTLPCRHSMTARLVVGIFLSPLSQQSQRNMLKYLAQTEQAPPLWDQLSESDQPTAVCNGASYSFRRCMNFRVGSKDLRSRLIRFNVYAAQSKAVEASDQVGSVLVKLSKLVRRGGSTFAMKLSHGTHSKHAALQVPDAKLRLRLWLGRGGMELSEGLVPSSADRRCATGLTPTVTDSMTREQQQRVASVKRLLAMTADELQQNGTLGDLSVSSEGQTSSKGDLRDRRRADEFTAHHRALLPGMRAVDEHEVLRMWCPNLPLSRPPLDATTRVPDAPQRPEVFDIDLSGPLGLRRSTPAEVRAKVGSSLYAALDKDLLWAQHIRLSCNLLPRLPASMRRLFVGDKDTETKDAADVPVNAFFRVVAVIGGMEPPTRSLLRHLRVRGQKPARAIISPEVAATSPFASGDQARSSGHLISRLPRSSAEASVLSTEPSQEDQIFRVLGEHKRLSNSVLGHVEPLRSIPVRRFSDRYRQERWSQGRREVLLCQSAPIYDSTQPHFAANLPVQRLVEVADQAAADSPYRIEVQLWHTWTEPSDKNAGSPVHLLCDDPVLAQRLPPGHMANARGCHTLIGLHSFTRHELLLMQSYRYVGLHHRMRQWVVALRKRQDELAVDAVGSHVEWQRAMEVHTQEKQAEIRRLARLKKELTSFKPAPRMKWPDAGSLNVPDEAPHWDGIIADLPNLVLFNPYLPRLMALMTSKHSSMQLEVVWGGSVVPERFLQLQERGFKRMVRIKRRKRRAVQALKNGLQQPSKFMAAPQQSDTTASIVSDTALIAALNDAQVRRNLPCMRMRFAIRNLVQVVAEDGQSVGSVPPESFRIAAGMYTRAVSESEQEPFRLHSHSGVVIGTDSPSFRSFEVQSDVLRDHAPPVQYKLNLYNIQREEVQEQDRVGKAFYTLDDVLMKGQLHLYDFRSDEATFLCPARHVLNVAMLQPGQSLLAAWPWSPTGLPTDIREKLADTQGQGILVVMLQVPLTSDDPLQARAMQQAGSHVVVTVSRWTPREQGLDQRLARSAEKELNAGTQNPPESAPEHNTNHEEPAPPSDEAPAQSAQADAASVVSAASQSSSGSYLIRSPRGASGGYSTPSDGTYIVSVSARGLYALCQRPAELHNLSLEGRCRVVANVLARRVTQASGGDGSVTADGKWQLMHQSYPTVVTSNLEAEVRFDRKPWPLSLWMKQPITSVRVMFYFFPMKVKVVEHKKDFLGSCSVRLSDLLPAASPLRADIRKRTRLQSTRPAEDTSPTERAAWEEHWTGVSKRIAGWQQPDRQPAALWPDPSQAVGRTGQRVSRVLHQRSRSSEAKQESDVECFLQLIPTGHRAPRGHKASPSVGSVELAVPPLSLRNSPASPKSPLADEAPAQSGAGEAVMKSEPAPAESVDEMPVVEWTPLEGARTQDTSQAEQPAQVVGAAESHSRSAIEISEHGSSYHPSAEAEGPDGPDQPGEDPVTDMEGNPLTDEEARSVAVSLATDVPDGVTHRLAVYVGCRNLVPIEPGTVDVSGTSVRALNSYGIPKPMVEALQKDGFFVSHGLVNSAVGGFTGTMDSDEYSMVAQTELVPASNSPQFSRPINIDYTPGRKQVLLLRVFHIPQIPSTLSPSVTDETVSDPAGLGTCELRLSSLLRAWKEAVKVQRHTQSDKEFGAAEEDTLCTVTLPFVHPTQSVNEVLSNAHACCVISVSVERVGSADDELSVSRLSAWGSEEDGDLSGGEEGKEVHIGGSGSQQTKPPWNSWTTLHPISLVAPATEVDMRVRVSAEALPVLRVRDHRVEDSFHTLVSYPVVAMYQEPVQSDLETAGDPNVVYLSDLGGIVTASALGSEGVERQDFSRAADFRYRFSAEADAEGKSDSQSPSIHGKTRFAIFYVLKAKSFAETLQRFRSDPQGGDAAEFLHSGRSEFTQIPLSVLQQACSWPDSQRPTESKADSAEQLLEYLPMCVYVGSVHAQSENLLCSLGSTMLFNVKYANPSGALLQREVKLSARGSPSVLDSSAQTRSAGDLSLSFDWKQSLQQRTLSGKTVPACTKLMLACALQQPLTRQVSQAPYWVVSMHCHRIPYAWFHHTSISSPMLVRLYVSCFLIDADGAYKLHDIKPMVLRNAPHSSSATMLYDKYATACAPFVIPTGFSRVKFSFLRTIGESTPSDPLTATRLTVCLPLLDDAEKMAENPLLDWPEPFESVHSTLLTRVRPSDDGLASVTFSHGFLASVPAPEVSLPLAHSDPSAHSVLAACNTHVRLLRVFAGKGNETDEI